ncbi:hypothetical protein LTR53_014300 [Teratosphaeriaceae sp. CCFEE 6253]|nr:hypothetical protein LTR53_014300 [Teratosphaeriaceae sp. CCFEE 6253]
MSSRVTRSRSRGIAEQTTATVADGESAPVLHLREPPPPSIDSLPSALVVRDTGLSVGDHRLLLLKQARLADPNGPIHGLISKCSSQPLEDRSVSLAQAASSTLVFAQKEAGTAVCISSSDSAEDLDRAKDHWLLFADGRVVKARCTAWNERRDLALLQVVASQVVPQGRKSTSSTFPAVTLAEGGPKRNAALQCIGHPGSEDLENELSGVATGYDVLHISEGRYRGLDNGQDVQDNSAIGALKHDCWTYWGHSGAPLVDDRGQLVGLHSSWDDETGMRRGVAWVAIKAFLEERAAVVV